MKPRGGFGRSVTVLPFPQSRVVVGLRHGVVLDAMRSGAGLDAPEELPSGSWVRASFSSGDFVYASARLRPCQRLGGLG